ncbi:hypothetical protein MMC25_006218 [Agyrium rufum]|nr:hypothetical protein [Agyrium rufum]
MATTHIPKYVNPPSRQGELIWTAVAMDATALVVLTLRLYTRKMLGQRFRLDDWIIIVANMMATVATVMSCLSTLGGTGLHIWDVPPNVNHRLANQLSYVQQFLYYPIIQATKLSILVFYYTLTPNVRFRLFTKFMIAFGICFLIADMIPEIFQCIPMSKTIFGASVQGKCINQTLFHLSNNCINLAQDLVILIMPVFILRGLQVSNRQRLLLAIAFCPGLLAIAAGCYRLKLWIAQGKAAANRNDPDSTWGRVDMYEWSNIEYCAALICASLPHLKALVARIIPEAILARTGGRSRPRSGANDLYSPDGSSGKPYPSAKRKSYGMLSGDLGFSESKSMATASLSKELKPDSESKEYILHNLQKNGKGIHVQQVVAITENRKSDYDDLNFGKM